MTTTSTLIPPPSPRETLRAIANAGAWIEVEEDDVDDLCAEATAVYEASVLAYAQLAFLTKPRIIKLENSRWEKGYDGESRATLLDRLDMMRSRNKTFGESIQSVLSVIESSVEKYKQKCAILTKRLWDIQAGVGQGPYVVEAVLTKARAKGVVKNLGYAGPIQLGHLLEEYNGDLVPPAGLAEGYHKAWMAAIQEKDQSVVTGEMKALAAFLDPLPAGF
jgi:hypothetical protein